MKSWIKNIFSPDPQSGKRKKGYSRFPFFLKCVFIFLGLAFFTSAAPLRGGTSAKKDLTVEDVSKKIEEAQASIRDVQMDLNLEMKDSLSNQKQSCKGAIKIKNPDKIFVHYTKPTEQFLYAQGDLLEMYQPDQKTVYEQHQAKKGHSAPVYLGVGKELKKYFDISRVTIIKNDGNEVGLLFIPLSENAGFDSMKVYIRKKDWWPSQMEMLNPSMETKARFNNFQFNKGLSDQLFQFKPPAETQVVEGEIF